MKHLTFVLLGFLASFTIISCGEDKDTSTTINLGMEINGQSLVLGDTYDLNGTSVVIDRAAFYLGGLNYVVDGADVPSNTFIFLIKDGQNAITKALSKESNKLEEIKFFVGVDPVTNLQQDISPEERDSSDPLSIQDPSMHWSWNTGYKFLAIDGKADLDNDGVMETSIAYHIGSNPFLTNISVPMNKELDGENLSIDLALNLNTFFQDVDFEVETDTHTGNNIPLAEKLTANLTSAFDLK